MLGTYLLTGYLFRRVLLILRIWLSSSLLTPPSYSLFRCLRKKQNWLNKTWTVGQSWMSSSYTLHIQNSLNKRTSWKSKEYIFLLNPGLIAGNAMVHFPLNITWTACNWMTLNVHNSVTQYLKKKKLVKINLKVSNSKWVCCLAKYFEMTNFKEYLWHEIDKIVNIFPACKFFRFLIIFSPHNFLSELTIFLPLTYAPVQVNNASTSSVQKLPFEIQQLLNIKRIFCEWENGSVRKRASINIEKTNGQDLSAFFEF